MKRPASSANFPHRSSPRKQKSAIKPTGSTRRVFLKQSRSVALVAFAGTSTDLFGADDEGWEAKSEPKAKTFEADADEILRLAMQRYTELPFGNEVPLATEGAVRDDLGNKGPASGAKFSKVLTQTVSWEEKAMVVYGATVTKYRKLQWEYSGNLSENYNPNSTPPQPDAAAKVGWLLQINGFSDDVFKLGDKELKPTTMPAQQYADGAVFTISGTDYEVTCGVLENNKSIEPQKVETVIDDCTALYRTATSFKVKHDTLTISFTFIIHLLRTNGTTFKMSVSKLWSAVEGSPPWPVEVSR